MLESNNITCANVGDSRAIIGRKIQNRWQSHQLTRDHKPNEKDEALRI
jgi:serine/threonine protein phosphatase PrpC